MPRKFARDSLYISTWPFDLPRAKRASTPGSDILPRLTAVGRPVPLASFPALLVCLAGRILGRSVDTRRRA